MTKQPFYQAIIRYAEDVVAAQPQPKLDPKKVQWSGYGELGNISQKPLQPTAEGAEEITAKKYLSDHGYGSGTNYSSGLVAALMTEYATLHAQKIAEENLREELIAYDKWLNRTRWGMREVLSPEKAVDRYLKSKEQ